MSTPPHAEDDPHRRLLRRSRELIEGSAAAGRATAVVLEHSRDLIARSTALTRGAVQRQR